MTFASLIALVINALSLYGIFRSAQNKQKEEVLRFYQNENKVMKSNLEVIVKPIPKSEECAMITKIRF